MAELSHDADAGNIDDAATPDLNSREVASLLEASPAKLKETEEFPFHTSAECCCCFSDARGACIKVNGMYEWPPTKFCYNFADKGYKGVGYSMGNGGFTESRFGALDPDSRKIKCKGLFGDDGTCHQYESEKAAQKRIGHEKAKALQEAAELQAERDEVDRAVEEEYRKRYSKGIIITKRPVVHGVVAAEKEGIITKGCVEPDDVCDIAFYQYEPPLFESLTRRFLEDHAVLSYGSTSYGVEGMWTEYDFEDVALMKKILKKGKPRTVIDA